MESRAFAIAAHGVRKQYARAKERAALNGFDLEVQPGTVCGLLGPNGAGKTTAVKILSTLLELDDGQASVAGFDVTTQARQVREHIGLVGQYAAIDEILTGRQNLVMFARLNHLSSRQAALRADALLEQFALMDTGKTPVSTFSGGMRRRLDLAASLIVSPSVLFVDEPTTGLDPAGRREVWAAIRSLVATGTTVLLTTQYLEEADQLAHRLRRGFVFQLLEFEDLDFLRLAIFGNGEVAGLQARHGFAVLRLDQDVFHHQLGGDAAQVEGLQPPGIGAGLRPLLRRLGELWKRSGQQPDQESHGNRSHIRT